MKKIIAFAATTILLAGCASPQRAAREAEDESTCRIAAEYAVQYNNMSRGSGGATVWVERMDVANKSVQSSGRSEKDKLASVIAYSLILDYTKSNSRLGVITDDGAMRAIAFDRCGNLIRAHRL